MTSENAAPAEMPGVEEIARAICREVNPVQFDDLPEAASYLERKTHFDRPILDKTEGRDIAREILALFAPILAEKEREIGELKGKLAVRMDHLVGLATTADRHAVAAERERCALIAAKETIHPLGEQIAAAIRGTR